MNVRKASLLAVVGFIGFVFILAARVIYLLVAFQSYDFLNLSPTLLTLGQIILLFLVVPLLVIIGMVILAKTIGANWWWSIGASIASLAILVYMETKPHNYAPFNKRETTELISVAIITVFLATAAKYGAKARQMTGLSAISILLILLVQLTTLDGFFLTLLAWILLPATSGLLSPIHFKEKDKTV